jgi:sterol 3beta-glucosyltransferase
MTAGLPSVPTPIFGDQFFWARRMNSIGVASRPIETKDFTAVNLANQIKIAMANTDIANKCSKLSERLKSEDGIVNAVTYLSNRIK